MVQGWVGFAHGLNGVRVIGKKPGGGGGGVNHGDNAVHGDAVADFGPVEGGDQRFRQR